jgi:solute carrier family 25 protein 34/35
VPATLTRVYDRTPKTQPLDVISTRLYQSQGRATTYSGPLDCAMQTVRAEGWAALQKGWLAQYSRLGPHTVLTFLFLEKLRPLVAALT